MKTSTSLSGCIQTEREARVTLNREAVLTESDGCTLDVTIVDVSKKGFRLQSIAELEVGSEVLLQMDKSPSFRGRIRWTCGHQAGGIFLDPVML